MKKKIILFIFLMMFCMFINVENYKAEYNGQIECYYEIKSSNGDYNQMWLHFEKTDGGDWKISRDSNGEIDSWYLFEYNENPVRVDYEILGYENINKNNVVCPSKAVYDISAKTITLSNNVESGFIYMLDSSDYSNYELTCDYEKRKIKWQLTSNGFEIKSVFSKSVDHGGNNTEEIDQTNFFTFENSILDSDNNNCPLMFEESGKVISFSRKYFELGNTKTYGGCYGIMDDKLCNKGTETHACVWVKDDSLSAGGYCNTDTLQYIACGGAYDIPTFLPKIISLLVNMLKIAAPIVLIMISILSLFKAMAAQKEDEIKKAQSGLIRKIIAAALVFFVISIVQFVIFKVANSNDEVGIDDCFDCFLNNKCSTTTYFRNTSEGVDVCRYLEGQVFTCPDQ